MSAFGNIAPPSYSQKAEVKPGDILASYSPPPLIKGVTIVKNTTAGPNGDGKIPAGTLLGRITASKKYGEYADAAGDGRGVARGVLLQSVDISQSDQLGNIVYRGTLKYSKLRGRDTAADTDLNARIDAERDYYIIA